MPIHFLVSLAVFEATQQKDVIVPELLCVCSLARPFHPQHKYVSPQRWSTCRSLCQAPALQQSTHVFVGSDLTLL